MQFTQTSSVRIFQRAFRVWVHCYVPTLPIANWCKPLPDRGYHLKSPPNNANLSSLNEYLNFQPVQPRLWTLSNSLLLDTKSTRDSSCRASHNEYFEFDYSRWRNYTKGDRQSLDTMATRAPVCCGDSPLSVAASVFGIPTFVGGVIGTATVYTNMVNTSMKESRLNIADMAFSAEKKKIDGRHTMEDIQRRLDSNDRRR
jgi:hypothetical protein